MRWFGGAQSRPKPSGTSAASKLFHHRPQFKDGVQLRAVDSIGKAFRQCLTRGLPSIQAGVQFTDGVCPSLWSTAPVSRLAVSDLTDFPAASSALRLSRYAAARSASVSAASPRGFRPAIGRLYFVTSRNATGSRVRDQRANPSHGTSGSPQRDSSWRSGVSIELAAFAGPHRQPSNYHPLIVSRGGKMPNLGNLGDGLTIDASGFQPVCVGITRPSHDFMRRSGWITLRAVVAWKLDSGIGSRVHPGVRTRECRRAMRHHYRTSAFPVTAPPWLYPAKTS